MLNHIEEKPQKQAHLGRRAHKFTGPFRLSFHLQETGMKPQLVMHPMVTLLVLWPCSRGVGRGRREAGRGEGRGRGGGKWGPLKPTLRGIRRTTTKPLETPRCTTPPSSLGLPLEGHSLPLPSRGSWTYPVGGRTRERAHPDLNQGPADLQSAALTTELCTQVMIHAASQFNPTNRVRPNSLSYLRPGSIRQVAEIRLSAVGFEPTRSCLQWILSPPP